MVTASTRCGLHPQLSPRFYSGNWWHPNTTLAQHLSSEVWFDPANRGDRPAGFKNLPYAADLDRQDAYVKWDTSLQFKPASADYLVEAFVDNLTDEEIKTTKAAGIAGRSQLYGAPGRTFGLHG